MREILEQLQGGIRKTLHEEYSFDSFERAKAADRRVNRVAIAKVLAAVSSTDDLECGARFFP